MLWGSFVDVFKYQSVKWNIVEQSLPRGGLDIRYMAMFNEVLLGKWLWRFMNEKERFWRTVINGKYGVEGLN